jgi:EmrB/QacA subfamily drug resistance transporter
MDAETPEPIRASTLTSSDIRSIFFGIMLAMLLSALDQTIVATAMPTIGRDLGQVENLPWVVTAYLLASTAVTPLYGKFSDMHGRRVTLLIGITIFIVGSIACALAPTMLALILARGVQGLGGGGLIAIAQTIVADMVTPRERGKYQVYFGAVFATASLGGPVLGGFIAQNLHWSFIFWINLPLGLLAFLLTNTRLKKLPKIERQHRLDVLGAGLLVAATTSFMLVLSWGGAHYAWSSAPILALAIASAVFWCAFALRMMAASEPLIPLQVLADRVVGFATLASALGMGTYIGLTIFVPIYFEVALGLTARQSGLALIPLMIGIVIGATVSGRLMARVRHYKRAPVAGVSIAVLSIGTVTLAGTGLPFPALLSLLFCASLGLGTVMPVATVAVQNAAPAGHLGTATATMNFSRQLLGAIVVAVYGAIVLSGQGPGGGLTLETLSGGGGNAELASTFRYVFIAATAGLAASLAFFCLMEERPLRDSARPEPASD